MNFQKQCIFQTIIIAGGKRRADSSWNQLKRGGGMLCYLQVGMQSSDGRKMRKNVFTYLFIQLVSTPHYLNRMHSNANYNNWAT